MSNENTTPTLSSSSLAWLADAPLFIEECQISAFYDAVVMPEETEGKTILEVQGSKGFKFASEAGGSTEIGTGGLIKLFPFLSAKATINAKASGERTSGSQEKQTLELFPITTPQRQLVQLALHYSAKLHDRLKFIEQNQLSDPEWRSKEFIRATPRALCFIELPGLDAVAESQGKLMETKLIPTAAEFSDGEVVLLYEHFRSKDGREMPPKYLGYDEHESKASREEKRKAYWNWFYSEFDPSNATVIVEQAAKQHGRIRWIDFRMPLNSEGESLHLHIYPAEKYDMGC
jgi:hypothetical protein